MTSKSEIRRLLPVIAKNIAAGTLFNSGFYSRTELGKIVEDAAAEIAKLDYLTTARSLETWREGDGQVLLWKLIFGEDETPYIGTPKDDSWPGDHKFWTPIHKPGAA